MVAWKLFRQLKDGSISPLFINKKLRLKENKWYKAEPHLTKGFAFRPGWHVMAKPHAPHLSKKDRVWKKVEIRDFKEYQRPISQGGKWFLAHKMRVISSI